MNRRSSQPLCQLLGISLLLAIPLAATAAAPETIEIGLLPTLSARSTLATYQPLRSYLQEHLKRPVVLVTAPDYRTYIERTQRREYHYVVTAPHFARLAQTEAGYRPLVRVQRDLQALLVTEAGTGAKRIADLRNQVVTTPDRLAVASMLGIELLRAHGLQPDRDVTVRAMPSFSSAVIALRNGEAAAAVTVATALNQMPQDIRARLTTLATSRPISHIMFLAGPQVPQAEAAEVRRLLLAFAGADPRGEQFFGATGFQSFTRIGEEELRALDGYVVELKKRLAGP